MTIPLLPINRKKLITYRHVLLSITVVVNSINK